jgi:S-layer homology domain
MRRLRQLALVLGSVALSGGFALGQARLGLYVVDSNDQKVGYVLYNRVAVIFIDGSAYSLQTGRDGFQPTTGFEQRYPDNQCNGTPYVQSEGGHILFADAQFTSDGVLHYPSESIELIESQSTRVVYADGTLGSCTGDKSQLFAAIMLTTDAPAFTPPFRVVDVLQVSPAPGVATFNDVPTNHPFFQYIEALSASGITAGCQASPPLYCPDATVTRGQMAVFLAKALGL